MLLVLYILIGLALGAFVSYAFDMETQPAAVIAICALGALVGGLVFFIVIPIFSVLFGIIGAIIGAILLMWAVSAVGR